MTTRAILSDLHAFSWSQFSKTDARGVNTRLQIVIDEMLRAADVLVAAGGTQMVLAGDLFHVRGSIDPAVFNPVHAAIETILANGIEIFAIPGNHDLKGKETDEIGNAIQSLAALKGFTVITEPKFAADDLYMVPWQSSPDKLREHVKEFLGAYTGAEEVDLIIHAPLNGVLIGVPDHGLDAAEVAAWGFRRVFCGHYHNHKDLGDGVYSIGATNAQTWSDIGAKAGFLIVDDKGGAVKWHASHAPSFVEVNEETDPEEIPLIVDGNYVRVRGLSLSDKEINELRAELLRMGAAAVSFNLARQVVSARSSTPAKALSLQASIAKYIEEQELPNEAVIQGMCDDVMSKVSALAA